MGDGSITSAFVESDGHRSISFQMESVMTREGAKALGKLDDFITQRKWREGVC